MSARTRLVFAAAAIAWVSAACGPSESTTAVTSRDVQVATTSSASSSGCARWLRDDVVAADLAAAVDAVRTMLDRDFALTHAYVKIDHATPPRIRVEVIDHRDEIE